MFSFINKLGNWVLQHSKTQHLWLECKKRLVCYLHLSKKCHFNVASHILIDILEFILKYSHHLDFISVFSVIV